MKPITILTITVVFACVMSALMPSGVRAQDEEEAKGEDEDEDEELDTQCKGCFPYDAKNKSVQGGSCTTKDPKDVEDDDNEDDINEDEDNVGEEERKRK